MPTVGDVSGKERIGLGPIDPMVVSNSSFAAGGERYFYRQIKPARNKILAHTDLATIQNKQTLGAFQKNADQEYFTVLAQFISVVQGSPFVFGAYVRNDARIFVNGLHKLLTVRR